MSGLRRSVNVRFAELPAPEAVAPRRRPAFAVGLAATAALALALTVAGVLVLGVFGLHRPQARPVPLAVSAAMTAAQRDAAEAQAGPTGAPLLWVVRQGDATIYLFGSVHVLRNNLNWMDPRLFQAFDMADEAWFELPDLDYQPRFKGFGASAYASRPVLLADLTATEKTQLATIVNRYNYTLEDLARVKPAYMAAFIAQLDETAGGFSIDRGVDYNLFRRAKTLDKKVDGFESNVTHYNYLFELAAPTQAEGTRALKAALADHFGTGVSNDNIHVLVGDWRAGDQKALTETVARMKTDLPGAYQTLLVKRNALWLPKIEAMLTGRQRVFATVGVAHLVGPDGLVTQLRARGYEVTRVDPQPPAGKSIRWPWS